MKYSDDDGHTWIASGVDIPLRRTRFDHPDPKVFPQCIVWQQPIRDAENRMLVGFTRWSSAMVYARPFGGNRNHLDSQCELMRFDNIDEVPHPKDLKITWLPDKEGAIRVSPGIEPEASRGYSLAEEPSIVLLPDGRIFMTMRTVTGYIWYTVSKDHGHSWRPPRPLLYRDKGARIEHPKSPEPMYRLADGRYLLLFHNQSGYRDGATGPWDMDARRPIYFTVGEFRQEAGSPSGSADRNSCSTHISDRRRNSALVVGDVFKPYRTWRPTNFLVCHRKQFVLGKNISDELLADMKVPTL